MPKNRSNKTPDPISAKVLAFLRFVYKASPGAVSPWLLHLAGIDLIPNYYAKIGSAIASTFSLLGFLFALAMYRQTSRRRMLYHLCAAFGGSIVMFLTCWITHMGLSSHWELDAVWEPFIYVLWFAAYFLIFVSMPVVLVLASYLVVGNDA
jgi:hypothetical protein